jgi:glutamate N-acetyltransferase/amino-acid N-acetyltransferase
VTRSTENVPAGFRFDSGGSAGSLLVTDGPSNTAAGYFGGTDLSAPALWSRQVLTDGRLRAVAVLPAVDGTGPEQFQAVHAAAERIAAELDAGAVEIAVCWADSVDSRHALRLTSDGWAVAGYGSDSALVLLVTDAVVESNALDTALAKAWPAAADETVLILASGRSGHTPTGAELAAALSALRLDLVCPRGGVV